MGLSGQVAVVAKALLTHITAEETEAGGVGFSAEDRTPGLLQCQGCVILPLALRDRLPEDVPVTCHQTWWAHLWVTWH